jgi:hypothetical protein
MDVLAHAKVAQILTAPQEEVEMILFTVLRQPVKLDHKVGICVTSFSIAHLPTMSRLHSRCSRT